MAPTTLSEEEVLVLMTYLGLPSILGLTPLATAGLPGEQVAYGLQVAERALIARGVLIRQPDMRLEVREREATLLQASANAAWVLTVTRDYQPRAQEPDSFHFYHSDLGTVAHHQPIATIHRFTPLEGLGHALRSAYDILFLNEEQAAPCPPITVPRVAFQAAYREGLRPAVAQWLPATHPASRYVAETLQGPHSAAHVAAFRPRHEPPQGGAFTLLAGGGWAWLLQPKGATETLLTPANERDVIGVLDLLANG
jgi:hypothetical protein